MSHANPRRIPRTRLRPPRCPPPDSHRRDPAAARRARLRRARRDVAAFPCANRHQARLQTLALAMLGYMADHWCGPGHEYDFDRWWRIVAYYARVLASPELAGRGACKTLRKVLDQDQLHPDDL